MRKIHLHPTAEQTDGRGLRDHVLFDNKTSYSSYIALLKKGEGKACLTILGSIVVRRKHG